MDVAASTDMMNWIFHRELNSRVFTKVCEQEESKNSLCHNTALYVLFIIRRCLQHVSVCLSIITLLQGS